MTRKEVSAKTGDHIFAGCALLGLVMAVIVVLVSRSEPAEVWVAKAALTGLVTTILLAFMAVGVFKIPHSS